MTPHSSASCAWAPTCAAALREWPVSPSSRMWNAQPRAPRPRRTCHSPFESIPASLWGSLSTITLVRACRSSRCVVCPLMATSAVQIGYGSYGLI
jgi:hypothetical protein